jgi:hypothetical protein
LICVLVAVCGAVVLHYWRTGAMAHRYLLLPSVFTAPLAGAAVCVLYDLLRRRWPVARAAVPAVVLTVALVAAMAVHASRPMHPNDLHLRQAGQWLCRTVPPGKAVIARSRLVPYYADRPVVIAQSAKRTPLVTLREALQREAGIDRIGAVVLPPEDYRSAGPDGADGWQACVSLLREFGLVQVATFVNPDSTPRRPKQVQVFLPAAP